MPKYEGVVIVMIILKLTCSNRLALPLRLFLFFLQGYLIQKRQAEPKVEVGAEPGGGTEESVLT